MALLGALFGWGLIAADGFAFAAILALAPGVANTEAAASAEIAASAEAVQLLKMLDELEVALLLGASCLSSARTFLLFCRACQY